MEVTAFLNKYTKLDFSDVVVSTESREYYAASFNADGSRYVFRSAKVTPKKIGLFVTLWCRNANGITRPFAVADGISNIIIYIKDGNRSGYFNFTAEILLAKKIMSADGSGGKRGIRVYPPWSKPISKQALATQKWQVEFFTELGF